MCGLMPSDTGYGLGLYPNLARYRTPQQDINDEPTYCTSYTATDNNNNNTYPHTAYNDKPTSPPYQPQTPQEGEEEEEEEFPTRTPRPPHHPTTTTNNPTQPTVFVPVSAAKILLWADEWRHCPLCSGNKVCLLRGKCVEGGRRVKIVFW